MSSSNYDAVTTTYNFTNAPTTVIRKHWNTASTSYPLVTIANTYIYDHEGRKLKSWEQITNGNSSPTTKTLLSQTIYNEVGQVMDKQLHSTDSVTFYQNIAYNYNERGWLTGSSAPLFSMQLVYNTATNSQYNGNIALQTWLGPGVSNSFSYYYDNLNRLTGGYSGDNYIENAINYDLNGNLTTLARYHANTAIDFLNYNYTSGGNPTNQLQSMADYCSDTSRYGYRPGTYSSYQYDANGNMTVMPTPPDGTALANINIQYNLLNLPQAITGGRNITYTYDATGNKLRKVSVAGQTTTATDYISGIQYKNNGAAIDFIQTEEGKVVQVSPGVYDYYYYLGDNLGNTRVTFDTQSGTATVQQQDDYYPFGLEINRNVNGTKNEYLYNKKELQEELGQYDYGARFYDPLIGRFTTIDPLAEKNRRYSSYTYGANNPVRFIDVDGMNPNDDYYSSTTGKYLGSDGASTNDDRLIDEKAYNSAIRQSHNTIDEAATEQLQLTSNVITVDNEKIQSDIQNGRDAAVADKLEHQVYIYLDRSTGTISSVPGETGSNAHSTISSIPDPSQGVNFLDNNDKPRNKILIGGVHDHPTSTQPGMETQSAMSSYDKDVSTSLQIPIYGVDAMSGSGRAGKPANINRQNPDGTSTNNVGKTAGAGRTINHTPFNIGKDALQIWGTSGKPTH